VLQDLDWLVPVGLTIVTLAEVPKRLLYCKTIEEGHRSVIYLRSLLSPDLQPHSRILIRHIHSINCADCKSEAFTALFQTGDTRETILFVTMAILDVGIDVPDIEEVVIFPSPGSASSIIQRSGRPARLPGSKGKAIVYLKKSDIAAAKAFLNEDPPDRWLLMTCNPAGPDLMPMDIDVDACISISNASQQILSVPKALLDHSKAGKCQVSRQHSKIAASERGSRSVLPSC